MGSTTIQGWPEIVDLMRLQAHLWRHGHFFPPVDHCNHLGENGLGLG
jgi:hypothetical protein